MTVNIHSLYRIKKQQISANLTENLTKIYFKNLNVFSYFLYVLVGVLLRL